MMNNDDPLKAIQDQVTQELLAKEQVYNQLRQTGEEAPAIIQNMMDTGIRVGDNASMLQLGVEVHPAKGTAFRAQTQNAISDATRHKFVPGATVYVKFNPKDHSQVALDHAPTDAPQAQVTRCPSCGAVQEVVAERNICAYCGSPPSD